MVSFRDLTSAFGRLEIEPSRPVIVHCSLSAFFEVRGGSEAMLGALLTRFFRMMMPAFTFKTMLTPEDGPALNGIVYGTHKDLNRMAEFYTPDMHVDSMIGTVAEQLRCRPDARRSMHPILSFSGVRVEDALNAQTLEDPLAPIRVLADQGSWVLLLGVNHTVNTSIHLAEKMAGRRQFVRWALTPEKVYECPGFPGCSMGFEQAAERLDAITRKVEVRGTEIRALPLAEMLSECATMIQTDPLALLCDHPDCDRCNSIRASVNLGTGQP
jgi:aminoglycoside 3-N-acetyltransferase